MTNNNNDEINLINRSLSFAKLSSIGSRTEESERCEAVNLYFEQTRDSLLQQYEWTFATKKLPLTKYIDTGNLNPDDCVLPYGIGGVSDAYPDRSLDVSFEIVDSKLFIKGFDLCGCNPEAYSIFYVSNNTPIRDYSALFKEALEYKLAYKITLYMRSDDKFTTYLHSLEKEALTKAIDHDHRFRSRLTSTQENTVQRCAKSRISYAERRYLW